MQFLCSSSSPWIAGRCQAMEVILSFTASGSLADSSGNYVHSFKAVSSSASWVCCLWFVAVSSHLPCPSFWSNVALKIWELDHSHLPLIRSKNKQYPTLFFKQALVLLSQPYSGGPGHPLGLEAPCTWSHLQPLRQPGQLYLHTNMTIFKNFFLAGPLHFCLDASSHQQHSKSPFLPADKKAEKHLPSTLEIPT